MRADAASIALLSNIYVCGSVEGEVASRFWRLSEKKGNSACGQGGELEIGGVRRAAALEIFGVVAWRL
jgi:hypothetical protein